VLARLLGPDRSLPFPLSLAVLFYFAHLLCSGWIASAQIFLGLSIIAAAVALARGEFVVRAHPLYAPLLLYAASSTISALLRPHPGERIPEVGEWFTFLAFPLALSLYSAIPSMLRSGRRALAVVATFLAGYGLVQFVVLGWASGGLEKRIRGTLSHVMTFSGIMLTLSIFFIVLSVGWLRDRDRSRPAGDLRLGLVAAVLATAALILTFTRSAWIGWVAAVGVAVLRTRPRWALALVIVALISVIASPLPLFARLISIVDLEQASNLDRLRMLQGGMEMIRDHPLFGVGVANVKEIYPLYRLGDAPRFRIPHLHNNVVQIWAERGLFALLAYVWFFVGFITECLRVPSSPSESRRYADAGLAAVVGLILAGMFEFNFGDSEVLHVTLAVMALTIAGIRQGERRAAPAAEGA
jgi:putative inorganic carbon (hco3(-)) transporter